VEKEASVLALALTLALFLYPKRTKVATFLIRFEQNRFTKEISNFDRTGFALGGQFAKGVNFTGSCTWIFNPLIFSFKDLFSRSSK